MNNEQFREYAVLAITEPYVKKQGDRLITMPTGHANWTKMIPTIQEESRWAVRSMLWVRKDLEAEQVGIQSSDLTAVVLRLPDRAVLVVSVYVPCNDAEALRKTIELLKQLIQEVRNKTGTRTDIVLAGDFNRHDKLWGGNDVSATRQGEADVIIDLMNEHALLSLLPRGTKTWQNGDRESTIDIILASDELAATVVKCDIHDTEHGSDHRAIETEFDVALPEHHLEPRLLWKNAPWGQIRERIGSRLRVAPEDGNTQEQVDRLMAVVQEVVESG
jgi:exonuclease III